MLVLFFCWSKFDDRLWKKGQRIYSNWLRKKAQDCSLFELRQTIDISGLSWLRWVIFIILGSEEFRRLKALSPNCCRIFEMKQRRDTTSRQTSTINCPELEITRSKLPFKTYPYVWVFWQRLSCRRKTHVKAFWYFELFSHAWKKVFIQLLNTYFTFFVQIWKLLKLLNAL